MELVITNRMLGVRSRQTPSECSPSQHS